MTSLGNFRCAYFNRTSKFGQNIEKSVFSSPENPEKSTLQKILEEISE